MYKFTTICIWCTGTKDNVGISIAIYWLIRILADNVEKHIPCMICMTCCRVNSGVVFICKKRYSFCSLLYELITRNKNDTVNTAVISRGWMFYIVRLSMCCADCNSSKLCQVLFHCCLHCRSFVLVQVLCQTRMLFISAVSKCNYFGSFVVNGSNDRSVLVDNNVLLTLSVFCQITKRVIMQLLEPCTCTIFIGCK